MNKSSIPWSSKQIARMYENGCLRFDNAIQRGEVWDIKRKSLFIDSLLRGYPCPPMFTIKTEEKVNTPKGDVNVFDCIDGKQRCTTISQFKNNEFALSGLEPIIFGNDELELNGLTYEELPEELRGDFDDANFTIYFFTDITDEEVKEMMDRLNNGKPLTGVEKARINSADLKTVMGLASHELFGEYLTEKAILGYANEDIVIKSFIQMTDEAPSFENKRVNEIYTNHVFTDEERDKLTNLFDKAREVFSGIENNAPKKILRKAVKKTNMLAILYYIGLNMEEDSEIIANKVEAFFTADGNILSVNEDYNAASKNATNRNSNIEIRNNALKEFCESYNS